MVSFASQTLQGWFHYDAQRGIDYRILLKEDEGGDEPEAFYQALRELSHLPITQQTPANQETGKINLIIPVHGETDTTQLLHFIQKFASFQSEASEEIKNTKGLSLHLGVVNGVEDVTDLLRDLVAEGRYLQFGKTDFRVGKGKGSSLRSTTAQ